MLADPTAEEEDGAQGSISVVLAITLPLSPAHVSVSCSSAPIMVHKPGGLGLRVADIKEVIAAARSRAAYLLPLLLQELL
jgi:hypothetical protein